MKTRVCLKYFVNDYSLFFSSPAKSIYPYIIMSYCFQPLFSKWNLQDTRKPRTQNYIFYFHL